MSEMKIKYLTVGFTIGGHELALETVNADDAMFIADLEDQAGLVQDKIKTALKNGVTFRMEKGKVITVNIGQFVAWANEKIDISGDLGTKLSDFFLSATKNSTTLDAVVISLWNLSFSTNKLSFTFFIRVDLDIDFYNGFFGANSDLQKIITIDSVGFGMYYSS